MSLNRDDLRADAEVALLIIPNKTRTSDNRCSISNLNRNQAGSVAGWAADERATIEARFWTKVNKNHACWLWTAATVQGYGRVALRSAGRTVQAYAHRLSYEFAFGSIPNGLSVLHRCDVPLCVRPAHLFVGTQADNLMDARAKGRLDESLPRTKKLSLSDRLTIYAAPQFHGSEVALARHYGVSKACISLVRSGRFAGAPTIQQRVA